jgi:hypothetical protein
VAWTTADRDALKSAIASGVRTVVYTDRTLTYQGTSDMLAALATIEADLAAQSSTPERSSRVVYSRGD